MDPLPGGLYLLVLYQTQYFNTFWNAFRNMVNWSDWGSVTKSQEEEDLIIVQECQQLVLGSFIYALHVSIHLCLIYSTGSILSI